jgi:hypothetical protein
MYRVSKNSWVTNSEDYCSAHIYSRWAVYTSMASSGLYSDGIVINAKKARILRNL